MGRKGGLVVTKRDDLLNNKLNNVLIPNRFHVNNRLHFEWRLYGVNFFTFTSSDKGWVECIPPVINSTCIPFDTKSLMMSVKRWVTYWLMKMQCFMLGNNKNQMTKIKKIENIMWCS